MKKLIKLTSIFLLFFLFLGCDFFNNTTLTTSNTTDSTNTTNINTNTTTVSSTTIQDTTSETTTILNETFTITFDSKGGLPVSPITNEIGEHITLPNTFKNGFTFLGWTLVDDESAEVVDSDFIFENDVTLYAKWTPNILRISIIDNIDGNTIGTLDIAYGTSLDTIDFSIYEEREGYTFMQWYPSIPTEMPNSNLVLYAEFKINQYTISFDTNDGSLISSIIADYDSEITLPEEPIKEGHSFIGWYEDEELSTSYEFTTMPSHDLTLYAKWEVNQYTVSFESNGGSHIMPVVMDFGSTLEFSIQPYMEGYTFGGWWAYENLSIPYKTAYPTMPAEDITLYASWSINTYAIWFNTMGGSNINHYEQDYNTVVIAPEIPVKEGYTFVGWYEDEDYINEYVFDYMPARSFTLVAKWVVNQYTITYITDGGTGVEPITADYDTFIDMPQSPTKQGYTFDGWYYDLDFTERYVNGHLPAMDITVYAKWKINQYSITFETYGGTTISSLTQDFNTTILAPSNPEREGYTFGGWYANQDMTLAFIFDVMPAEDQTIYAKWNINSYTLQFIDDDGTVLFVSDYEFGFDISQIIEPTPMKIGYSFTGWDLVLPSTMPSCNLTLKAEYSINQYTISFMSNGGSIVPSIIQDFDSLVDAPNIPIKVGYSFMGWYLDNTYSEEYMFTTIPAQDLSLYARWEINQYTILFDTQGGSVIDSIEQDYMTIVTQPVNPIKTGYTFAGWYTDQEHLVAYVFDLMQASNITLYAKWNINTYTLQYIDYDGTVLYINDFEFNSDLSNIMEPSLSRIGYTFTGWSEECPETMPDHNLTIVAGYDVNQYTITFDTDGGELVDSYIFDYGAPISSPDNPTKIGYTFNGWFADEDYTIQYQFDIMPAEDITIYAKWTINQYTISFESNGGSSINSITDFYLQSVEQPTNPIRIGYTFVGWYTNQDMAVLYTFSTIPAEDIILYAKWIINTYTISFMSNGGTDILSITQEYDSSFQYPENPVREGYSFVGWYLDAEYNEPSSLFLIPSQDTILYAKWEIQSYSISFESNGGSNVDSLLQEYDSLLVEPDTPIREGYTFSGWFEDISLTSEFVFDSMPASDLTLYAKWSINSYIIQVQDWDGTIMKSQMFEFGSDISQFTLPVNPLRTGYTFVSWDQALPTYMPAQDLIVTAQYNINTYFIVFNDYNGSLFIFYELEYGADLSHIDPPDDPVRLGYTFTGWNNVIPSTMPVDGVLITATYSINQYSISFEENGGTTVSNIIQDYNSEIIAPDEPTRIGYTFNGWYADEQFVNLFEFTTMPYENITLYALWEVNQYTISFVSNGGTTVVDITDDYGNSVDQPTDPTRAGCEFLDWYSDEDLTSVYVFDTIPAENITLYAKWNYLDYTLYRNVYDEMDPEIGLVLNFGETIVDILSEVGFTIVLTSEGRVFTWGSNEYGQLGNGTLVSNGIPQDITGNFPLHEGELIVCIAQGHYTSGVLTNLGRVFTWGRNDYKQMGVGTVNTYSNIPVEVLLTLGDGECISVLEMGGSHAGALTNQGRLFVWGSNAHGQLGDGTLVSSYPEEIINQFYLNTEEEIVYISFGWASSAVITSDNRIFTWGYNAYGQLGDGTTNSSSYPINITSQFTLSLGETFEQVEIDARKMLLVTSEGRLFTSGMVSAQIGTYSDPSDITSYFGLVGAEQITSVSIGGYHVMVLTSENRVLAFGGNQEGQIGLGFTSLEENITDITSYLGLEAYESIEKVVAGWLHSIILTDTDLIKSWGDNAVGQIGDGTMIDRLLPTKSSIYAPFVIYSSVVTYDSTLSLPIPTREGYTFSGWYLDSEFAVLITEFTMPPYNAQIYGYWIQNE